MNTKFFQKWFCCVIVLLVFCFVLNINISAARNDSPEPTITYLEEQEFDSLDELEEWINNWAMENPDNAREMLKALKQLKSETDRPDTACKNVTLTPSSISATKPFHFKLYQIIIDVYIGDCGSILCSTMGFDITWNPGPSGGTILIGPFPSQTFKQICQGESISSRGFLILKSDVPNGSYKLKIKVGGFGYASYYYIPVNIN